MKKFTQLCGFAFLGIIATVSQSTAQITITKADMPYAGLTVITATDSTSGYVPGSPSASTQNWNFGALKKQKTAKVSFMAPSSTPYASSFPRANLADSTYGVVGYNYFLDTTSAFSVIGSEQVATYQSYTFHVKMNLNPPFEQSSLPATYNSIIGGVSRGSQKFNQSIVIYDSERIAVNITYSDTVDAWGTMTTPKGAFSVLRQKHDEVDVDSIFGHNAFSNAWGFLSRTVTKTYQYNWYTNGTGYILVQMNMDSTSATVKNVIWDTTAIPTGINELSYAGKISVYPNPCSSQLNFNSTIAMEQHISVYDITGREMDKVEMLNGKATLNTDMYTNGLYLYQVTDKSGNIIDRGKFSVQK